MGQSTSNLLMIRPASFGFNEQTAESNTFQKNTNELVHEKALQEFDAFVNLLSSRGVSVMVQKDTDQPQKPDAIFPNNWVSFHENGDVILYPMQAENRRFERREDIIRKLEDRFQVNHIIDLSRFELQDKFLESTGSMVLDRENKLAYACLSPRTNEEVLQNVCEYLGYQAITFNAVNNTGQAIYHTNVMMCIGSQFAIICLDSITHDNEKQKVIESLKVTGKEIIAIELAQLNHFAGNMLEVTNNEGKKILVMSKSAYSCLNSVQVESLKQYVEIIYADLTTIEAVGGGSARCMLAEVHLPTL
ncbi:citrulline utilization hydrolase CtlX [Mucilaginibacter lacusdianchii]|uniref:citrulline utilization hydrolase CtlX n=1 Tax=Mucilaginibacter lacusdianchii TaxID=2684211 RepID=UPI0018EF085A|nr:arginine deiminase-related protein [Mucilaginibacter sp. JXJ CY 39]